MRGIGIEIEFTGVKRSEVISALEGLFRTTARPIMSKTTEDNYFYYKIEDEFGDTWTIKRDRSIVPQAYLYKLTNDVDASSRFDVVDVSSEREDYTEYMVELVSPVLTSSNLFVLFSIVDVIKSIGGLVNSSCGMHIHVDGFNDAEDLASLYRKFVAVQDDILDAFNVEEKRIERYCKKYDLSNVSRRSFYSVDDFLGYLFSLENYYRVTLNELRELRYYALNFYAMKQHGTVEFRLFNATLDKADIVSAIDWVLHFAYPEADCLLYLPVLSSALVGDAVV